ncbi:hypothetical protein EG329_012285 [Mollisiaceae sp. DMI_Dod_QoI]|nr:hypothetical protein EG329_012285 [Helotiales sp. DMI_Dod_QoI]
MFRYALTLYNPERVSPVRPHIIYLQPTEALFRATSLDRHREGLELFRQFILAWGPFDRSTHGLYADPETTEMIVEFGELLEKPEMEQEREAWKNHRWVVLD